MKNWFKSWFATAPTHTCEQAELLLQDRSTAEIAARLMRRAELHDEGNAYLQRCAVLDRVAADNMRRLVRDAGMDIPEWVERRDLCLRLLREDKN